MTTRPLIVNLKRAVIACMAIALAITSSLLFMKNTPRQDHVAAKVGEPVSDGGTRIPAPKQPGSADDHLASVAVIILNSGKELPLALKVGDKYIKIPGPSDWPKGGDDSSGPGEGRFLAGIVDTADVLKSNGFNPYDIYSLAVGGTELTNANTFRVSGATQADIAKNTGENYIDEYKTLSGEQGIWRSLRFRNIVLRYGQVPSLADFLVSPRIAPAKDASTSGAASTPRNQNLAVSTEDTADQEALTSTRKYLRELGNADPAIRSDAIQNLMLYDYEQIKSATDPSMESLLEKSLADTDPIVRKAAMDSLNMWDGSVAQQSLSRIALNDEIPELRMRALDLLVDRFSEKAVPTLQQARNDPDYRIAQRASELLAQFQK